MNPCTYVVKRAGEKVYYCLQPGKLVAFGLARCCDHFPAVVGGRR